MKNLWSVWTILKRPLRTSVSAVSGVLRWACCALPLAVALAQDPVYIVHWTSQEKCHECPGVYAVMCSPSVPDCGVPLKTVDHFEIAASRQAALGIANEISREKTKPGEVEWSTGAVVGMDCLSAPWVCTGTSGNVWVPPAMRARGTLVAIYEAKPLPIKVETKTKEVPQPPIKRTETTVTLEAK